MVYVIFNEAGIYFNKAWPPLFSPPFLLPWESVKWIRKDGLFGRSYRLEIEDPEGSAWVRLPGKVEQDLFRYYDAHH